MASSGYELRMDAKTSIIDVCKFSSWLNIPKLNKFFLLGVWIQNRYLTRVHKWLFFAFIASLLSAPAKLTQVI